VVPTEVFIQEAEKIVEDANKKDMILRILGGLGYTWERDVMAPLEAKRRLKLLLNCDVEIKTGRLKPNFALEKLVISLCGAAKPFG
jgi:hypothetical protein